MKYMLQYKVDGQWTEAEEFINSADIYMEMMEQFDCEEFAMEMEDWCDNATDGDIYEDDDVKVKACA